MSKKVIISWLSKTVSILVGILIILNIGCRNKEISPIEVILIDQKIIDEISNPENSDSIYIEYPIRKDFGV